MKLDVTKPTKLAEISNAVLIGGGKSLYIVDSNGTPIMGGLASSGQLGVGGLSSDVYTLSGKSNVVRTDGQIASNVLSMTSSVGGVHSAYAGQ